MVPANITVVNKKTHRECAHDVYIGRPSVLGNPFPMDGEGTRQLVVDQYLEWLRNQYRNGTDAYMELCRLAAMYKEGKTIHLVCFCAPKACHGDVVKSAIIKIAGE